MIRFTDMRRIAVVGDGVIIGASGEMSDFQYIKRLLDELRCAYYQGHFLAARSR